MKREETRKTKEWISRETEKKERKWKLKLNKIKRSNRAKKNKQEEKRRKFYGEL